MSKRPAVRIRFRYNKETGQIEELIVDDQAPEKSEDYHDKVAHAVASLLARQPEIEDAGPRAELEQPTQRARQPETVPQRERPPESQSE
jgi:hypothetical protein